MKDLNLNAEEIVEAIRGTHAVDFQDIVAALAKMAGETFDASGDNAWFDACKHLTDAADAIARRSGD